ncbi:Mitotic-spindle organizing protein 1 [Exophiala mesophila]|uniref:Mitotic-spindle organizing protein 1 n=1 Tax=Exophiala mesophila TaxID=212818 RepID=A0A438N700_EXOME|nr:Mitotic-spindle organizing protein 1 [Exophiala mesophila]
MAPTDSKREKAREVVDILEEISALLNTQLDRTQLSLCVSLIENGVNPEALATAIKELRRETQDLQQDTSASE